ncbi:metallophosphoesterase [Acinetobacter bereziniae]|uniref:metallophosphoesterase n=1 Tax=Acinetobacter bereziniae TaxID=106648 RepID=UPI0035A2611F
MKNLSVQRIYDALIDIIVEIHCEINALQNLMQILGYDRKGSHNESRKLIFVGDLCDRGLDSVAVIKLVKYLIDNDNAQCVLGNH